MISRCSDILGVRIPISCGYRRVGLEVARLRAHARRAGLTEVAVQGNHVRFTPVELRESQQLRLNRLYPGTISRPTTRTILVPKPTTARIGGQPLRDGEVLRWARDLVDAVLLDSVADAARVATNSPRPTIERKDQ